MPCTFLLGTGFLLDASSHQSSCCAEPPETGPSRGTPTARENSHINIAKTQISGHFLIARFVNSPSPQAFAGCARCFPTMSRCLTRQRSKHNTGSGECFSTRASTPRVGFCGRSIATHASRTPNSPKHLQCVQHASTRHALYVSFSMVRVDGDARVPLSLPNRMDSRFVELFSSGENDAHARSHSLFSCVFLSWDLRLPVRFQRSDSIDTVPFVQPPCTP